MADKMTTEDEVAGEISGGMILGAGGCGPAAPILFLHIVPADSGDLPEHRREPEFDKLKLTRAFRMLIMHGL